MSPTSNDLGLPDSAIRLAAAVHRFRTPKIPDTRLSKQLSYAKSFNMASNEPKTRQVMLWADTCRTCLMEVTQSKYLSYSRVGQEAKRYIPVVYQILLSCKLQPEEAQLDVPLVFEWMSGIEQNPKPYTSKALMYELVMSVVCEGLARAGSGAESSASGEYSAAGQDFAGAAGIFHYLADTMLPTWTYKGGPNVKDETLPSECSVAMAQALQQMFLINGQQQAVAVMMMKPDAVTTNGVLLSKVCLGILQQLEAFVSHMRKDCKIGMERMDKDFFSLLAVQMGMYKSLMYYFQARGLWAKREYGVALAVLKESMMEVKTRDGPTSAGIPDLSKISALSVVNKDLQGFRAHLEQLFKLWKQDNSSVFFERVPAQIPADMKLKEGEPLNKWEDYKLDVVEPVVLKLTMDKRFILTGLKPSGANRRGIL